MDYGKHTYSAPALRVVGALMEQSFLLSWVNGVVDPGMDEPWGDF